MKCSALKQQEADGTRCANGFLDTVGCQRPDLVRPPCMREEQAPLPNRIDWTWLQEHGFQKDVAAK